MTSTYDISTNTINISGSSNSIQSIFSEISNPSVISYNSITNVYTLNAKIDSINAANLNIENTTLLMNNTIDEDYYIKVGWTFITKNATIKSNNGKRFYIWIATKGGNGWSTLLENTTIDGGYVRIRTGIGYYDKPGSPYVRIINTTIKNVDLTNAPSLGDQGILSIIENAGLNLYIDGLNIDNTYCDQPYASTIVINSGATNATFKNINITNSKHSFWGAIHMFGGAQNVILENVYVNGANIGLSNKEGLWNVGTTHYYKNISIINPDSYGYYTYQNMWTSDYPSGAKIENLIIDGGINKVGYIYYQQYAQTNYNWIFNAELKNAAYGFLLRNNKVFLTNVTTQNITTTYSTTYGIENGEANWYELLDIQVIDINNIPINNADITITPNVTAPVPNIIDKWFNPRTNIKTVASGHIPLPSNETGMVALLRQRDSSSGTVTTLYNYNITATYSGLSTTVNNITPLTSWYRPDPLIPTNTITIQIPIDVGCPIPICSINITQV